MLRMVFADTHPHLINHRVNAPLMDVNTVIRLTDCATKQPMRDALT